VKVHPGTQQVIPEELARRVAELAAQVSALTRRLDLYESANGNGNRRRDQESNAVISGAHESENPIELITENGFSIVRPWESGSAPAPVDGKCRFLLTEPTGIEREVTVEISHLVMRETSLHTRGRIDSSSSFWICCAERYLADYVDEHGVLPAGNQLTVETLNCEDDLLALRWDRSHE
jgi:hypothetical protein